MHSLREIQTGFAAALFDPGASRQAPGIRSSGISPSQRLGFYRTNVFENYRKALSVTYAAVEQLIGPGLFGALAREYALRYHSHSGDVGEQGAHFAEFISKHQAVRELPYLADVARLEWALEESFNESDPQVLSMERLSKVPPELYGELRFLIAPSARFVSSRYPIDRIWEMCQPDFPGEERIDLNAGGVDLLVRRERFSVVTERMTRAEHAMLRALASGYELSGAFDYAHSIAATFDATIFLQRYLGNGVLADFTLPSESTSC